MNTKSAVGLPFRVWLVLPSMSLNSKVLPSLAFSMAYSVSLSTTASVVLVALELNSS